MLDTTNNLFLNTMNNTQYTAEELEILDFLEGENPDGVPNLEAEKERSKKIFSENATKRKAVSLRLLERDLQKVRTKALAQGIPYQTLISSIVHQYVNDRLVAKD